MDHAPIVYSKAMPDILTVIMRWLHISSMATLIGGMLYGRLVMAPAASELAPETAEALSDRAAAHYKPLVVASMIGLILSGVYRFLITPGHRPLYQTLFGIKMLLVMHVFAVAILIVKPHNPRRTRMMTGVMISGLTIIAISAWLSRIY
jgi:uncharacterized membrane protein